MHFFENPQRGYLCSEGTKNPILCQSLCKLRRRKFSRYNHISISIRNRISSKNNSRKYNGTTDYESKDDPFKQLIHVHDWPQQNSTREVTFTNDELYSTNGTFCKGISKTLDCKNSF